MSSRRNHRVQAATAHTQQEAPFCVQVEPTEGCNLMCRFCGIHGIRRKGGDYKFMTVDTARAVAQGIAAAKWTARVEFAMHGEPTRNPHMVDIIRVFRAVLPNNQLTMLSNGTCGFTAVEALIGAGLDIFAVDNYKDSPKTYQLREELLLNRGPATVYEYPRKRTASPHRRWPRNLLPAIVMIEDISVALTGTHAVLNNHCGNAAPPLRKPLEKRCAKVFRELAVRWNGDVAICCNDFRGVYSVGNVLETPPAALWQCERFAAARRLLYAYDRGFAPCCWCSAVSYRTGCLPDKLGKQQLEAPTAQDRACAATAVSGDTLSPKVLQRWEDPGCVQLLP